MIKITADSFMGIIYTLVLAIIIAVFVGVTIDTFYPAPDYPEKDAYEMAATENRDPTPKEIAEDKTLMEEYQQKHEDWSMVASIAIVVAATALVILGLFMANKMPIIPNGVLLGGLFTLFYGVILGFESANRYVTFGVTAAALAVVIAAGYTKFVKTNTK